jgi:phosphoglycerate dehydrogenase-like enzyme
MPKILIASRSPELEKTLHDIPDGVDLHIQSVDDPYNDHLEDTEVLWGVIEEDDFARAKALKWVHQPGIGVERHMYPAFKESDVVLTNCKGQAGTQISEHAFALLFALTRRVLDQHDFMKKKHWERIPCFEMAGKTMGIVALGSIGTAMAYRAHAFGMRVLAVDPEPIEKPDFVERLEKPEWIGEMMAQCDVVVSCCPITPKSHRVVSADAIGRMKSDSYFINISRGKVVDEEALIHALQSGRIAGAGLDVTYEEPLPEDSPLWDLPNVILTSHSAGASDQGLPRSVDLFVDNLNRYVKGETLRNVVDKEKGY